MTHEITKKIIGFAVKDTEEDVLPEDTITDPVEHMNESIPRPEKLIGSTYKIKPPMVDHAMYVTINDIILNEGTENECHRPFEIFINSKNMEQFQWIVALTRLISAVFRKGGEVTFMVDELKAVFDPKGGYFKGGGKFIPSLVAELGEIIEGHLKGIGLIETCSDSNMKSYIESKKAELSESTDTGYPENATVCNKCNTKAVVVLDGCQTCLACGDSKCG